MEVKDRINIEKEVEKLKSDLVNDAENLIRDKEIWREDGLKEAQFRNLMNVANSTTSVPVITNFIKYQIGRSKVDKGWNYKKFGELFIQLINNLKSKSEKSSPEYLLDVWIRLTRLLIGYMIRAYKYENSINTKKRNKE
jgi:hypothetical protein